MNEIAIYVEGGGDTATQKAELRRGFDALLGAQKNAARTKKLCWRLVPSGGRDQTYKAFMNEVQQSGDETLCVLLVDSEDSIAPEELNEAANGQARKQHLLKREQWKELKNVPADQIHLMVQCMETWIVADPESLEKFYGQGFQVSALPIRQNLEEEPKVEVYAKLAKATKNTTKKEYGKIKHAAKLLERITPAKISNRCSRFKTFTNWLTKRIESA